MFGSDEYFALLKQNPKLGSYFSLGERVVVVLEGRVYQSESQRLTLALSYKGQHRRHKAILCFLCFFVANSCLDPQTKVQN